MNIILACNRCNVKARINDADKLQNSEGGQELLNYLKSLGDEKPFHKNDFHPWVCDACFKAMMTGEGFPSLDTSEIVHTFSAVDIQVMHSLVDDEQGKPTIANNVHKIFEYTA